MNRVELKILVWAGLVLLGLGGCATEPMGPTVAVMPGKDKSFDAFSQDQATCKQYASQQVSGEAEAANTRAVGGAILGTALGAGLGAAVGNSQGAGVGAATGAIIGTGIGAGSTQEGQYSIQRQYNIAYQQCMYSKGNQVPGRYARPSEPPPAYYSPPPPPPPGYYPPPPPPGSYPPPPPGSYPPPPQ